MLPEPSVLHGVAARGLGKATFFTGLEWVSKAFAARLGFSVWPGTFNVLLTDTPSLDLWAEIGRRRGIEIEPPDASACVARCFRVQINERVGGAIVLPHVPGYPRDQVEIVAALSIRSALEIQDGDPVTVSVFGPFDAAFS